MFLKSVAEKIVKPSLWEQSGGITCPNFPFRDGAKDTTVFGWDFDTGLKEIPQRFHHAVDRGYGKGTIYTPVAFDGGIFSTDAGDFGNLLRLFYADNDHGWELRIAHMSLKTDIDQDFLKLVKVLPDKNEKKQFAQYSFAGLSSIPGGILIGAPGELGVSMKKHTHTELISLGGRNAGLDELLQKRGFYPNIVYKFDTAAFDDYLATSFLAQTKRNILKGEKKSILDYLDSRGYTAVGPYEAHGFDDRTNQNCIWYSTRATLNI